jgi:hypothetical protein
MDTSLSRSRNQLKRIQLRALQLMAEFNWGEHVTGLDLGKFVDKYPDYRLTIVQAGINCYAGYTFTGSSYVLETCLNRKTLTRACNRKTLYIVWDPETLHYGGTNNALLPHQYHRRTNLKFCHQCISCFKTNCRCSKPVPKPLLQAIKECKFCGRKPCMGSGCTRNCNFCGVTYKYGYNRNDNEGHRCIVYSKTEPKTFLKPGDEPQRSKDAPYKLWVYDIEATTSITETIVNEFVKDNNEFVQINGEYEVFQRSLEFQQTNMVVFRDVYDPDSEKVYFGENSLNRFISFMLNHNYGKNICIAHNGSGYDTRLICEELSTLKMKVVTSATSTGSKFIELRANHTIFRDSLLHLPGSLAGLAKSFDLTLRKGVFPHLFNKPENYGYEGNLPDKKFFDLTFSAKTQRDIDDFNTWYDERSQRPWNFMEELTQYCKDDVNILSQIVRSHDEICVNKFGFSPWFSSTSPSYCHKVIKSQLSDDELLRIPDEGEERSNRVTELAWNEHWGVLLPQEYWHARRALIGGRTDVRRIHYRLSPDDISKGISIKYQDIVSMYPYVQARKDLFYPVGLPRIKIYDPKYYPCTKHQSPTGGRNKLDICDCDRRSKFHDRLIDVEEIGEQPTVEYMADFNTFGIATVSMIPPKNLFHPVLVVWDEDTGKRTSTLEPLIEQTYTTIEIQLALSKGYILTRVHRLDLYNKAPALWSDFVKDLYIEKLANSGPPPSLEEQEFLVNAYEEDFGIGEKVRESFHRWELRLAMRLVFKVMLNSGWGKHCQRPNLTG